MSEEDEYPDFFYVGERSLWRYRNSGWGLMIPRIDAERLGISKTTVAKMYVSYSRRVIILKFVDVRKGGGIEEEVLSILSKKKPKKEDVQKLIEKLKEEFLEEQGNGSKRVNEAEIEV